MVLINCWDHLWRLYWQGSGLGSLGASLNTCKKSLTYKLKTDTLHSMDAPQRKIGTKTKKVKKTIFVIILWKVEDLALRPLRIAERQIWSTWEVEPWALWTMDEEWGERGIRKPSEISSVSKHESMCICMLLYYFKEGHNHTALHTICFSQESKALTVISDVLHICFLCSHPQQYKESTGYALYSVFLCISLASTLHSIQSYPSTLRKWNKSIITKVTVGLT